MDHVIAHRMNKPTQKAVVSYDLVSHVFVSVIFLHLGLNFHMHNAKWKVMWQVMVAWTNDILSLVTPYN